MCVGWDDNFGDGMMCSGKTGVAILWEGLSDGFVGMIDFSACMKSFITRT